MFKQLVDFIHEIYGTDQFVPLHAPYFGGKEKEYLNECIDSTFVSSVGPFVDRFEEMIAAYTGTSTAVVCVNGTNALHMALLLCGVEREDEVITQPLTFVATCNALSYLGAHPVFLDVDADTLGLSPVSMREYLTTYADVQGGVCFNRKTGRRIKACVPMHTFGHPGHLTELQEVCREFHLELVEDAAEAAGSLYHGKHVGTLGKVGVLSFNGNKTVTTGGGGMLLFNDPDLAKFAKHLTTQAKEPHRWNFVHDHIGYNYRMPNINAALGCAQLEQLPAILANKRETAKLYHEFFDKNLGMEFFTEPANCCSNYWLNAVLLPDRKQRDEFLEYTNDHGVMTRPVWELMNRLNMFQSCECGPLDQAEQIADRLVNLPSGMRKG